MCNNSLQPKPNFPLEKEKALGFLVDIISQGTWVPSCSSIRAEVTRTPIFGRLGQPFMCLTKTHERWKLRSYFKWADKTVARAEKTAFCLLQRQTKIKRYFFYQCHRIIKLSNQTNLLNLIFSPQTRPKSRYRWPVTSSEMHHKIKSRHSASYLSIGSKKYNIWRLLAYQTRPELKKRRHQ